MADVTIQQLLYRLGAWILVLGAAGWAAAAVARLLGDPGPARDGRASPNPVRHVDAVGLIATLLFRLGWAQPLRLDAGGGARGALRRLVVGASGPAAVLALAAVVRWLEPVAFAGLATSVSLPLLAFGDTVIALALRYVALNLWPLPPLALGHVWPLRHGRRDVGGQAWLWGVRVALLAAAATGVLDAVVEPVASALARLLGVA